MLETGTCTDPVVLRGAVCFIAMGLWGSQRVDALFYSPVAVLNSLRSVLPFPLPSPLAPRPLVEGGAAV